MLLLWPSGAVKTKWNNKTGRGAREKEGGKGRERKGGRGGAWDVLFLNCHNYSGLCVYKSPGLFWANVSEMHSCPKLQLFTEWIQKGTNFTDFFGIYFH